LRKQPKETCFKLPESKTLPKKSVLSLDQSKPPSKSKKFPIKSTTDGVNKVLLGAALSLKKYE